MACRCGALRLCGTVRYLRRPSGRVRRYGVRRQPTILTKVRHNVCVEMIIVIPLAVDERVKMVLAPVRVGRVVFDVVGFPCFPVAIHETRPYRGVTLWVASTWCDLPERLSSLRSRHPLPGPFRTGIAAAEPSLAVDDLVEEDVLCVGCKGCEVPGPTLNFSLCTPAKCILP